MRDCNPVEVELGESLLLPKEEFSVEEMNEAFKYVQDTEHWKNPIYALVPSDMLRVVEKAIVYYTGSWPEVYPTDDLDAFIVEADGYFIAIGA